MRNEELNDLIGAWSVMPPFQSSDGKRDDEWVKLERAHEFISREINMTKELLHKVNPDKRFAPLIAKEKGMSIDNYYHDLLMKTCEVVQALECTLPIVAGYLSGIFSYLEVFGYTKLTEGGDNDKSGDIRQGERDSNTGKTGPVRKPGE